MAFRFPTPPASSSSIYNNFSDQPPEDGIWIGRIVAGAPGGSEFFREVEKKRIRDEILAAEQVARKRFLEAEVWRELEIERQMIGIQTGGGYPPSFILTPPYSHHERFHPGMPHDQSYALVERRPAMPFPEDYGGGIGPPVEIMGLDVVPSRWRPPSPRIKEIITSVPEIIGDCVTDLAKPYRPIKSGTKRKPPPPPMAAGSTDLCHASKKKMEEWSCAICEVTATSERSLQDHLDGKKHQAKMADMTTEHTRKTEKSVIKNSPVNSKDEPAAEGESSGHKFRFWCKMCKVGAFDENVMKDHKKGKKHLKNRLKVRRKSRGKARSRSRRNDE